MRQVTFDRRKPLRQAERARQLNVASYDVQARYLATRDVAAQATLAREKRETELARRLHRFDAQGIVREPPDREFEKLRAAEAEELAEVERLRLERDRLSDRWRNVRALVESARDTLRNLGVPVAELERI